MAFTRERKQVRGVGVNANFESKSWFVAQVKPNQLAIAERNLGRQGFAVFCPKERRTSRRAGKFVDRLSPLFTGYLFVGADRNSSDPGAIDSTYGIVRVIRSTRNVPAPVPQDFIRMLANRCDQEGVLASERDVQRGDSVRLIRGPFADLVAKIEHIGSRQRVWILLELMGLETRISVNAADVQLCA